jgi:8-oxo-dGTP pyrophosphatase MutT (NUDIX family)
MTDTHSTSGCLLQLPDGRFVFQRRTKDAPISPGLLSLFGGHIEQGEKPLHALRRELSEETSLDAGHIHVHHAGTYRSREAGKGLMNLYVALIKTPEFKVLEGKGHETYSLREALGRDDIDPDARYVMEAYQALKDSPDE